MKYTALFGLAALMALTACDAVEDGFSEPQKNPQLPEVTATAVDVTDVTPSTLDLASLSSSGSTITVARVSVVNTEEWPEGFTPVVNTMQISNTENFDKTVEVDASTQGDGQIYILPDDWETAHVELYGTTPKTQTTYVRFPVFAVNGKQSVRMGSDTQYYGTGTVHVTPVDQYNGQVIEDNYYLLGSFCNWDVTKAIKMSHSSTNPYDDPVFTVIADVKAAGYEWVVIPESTFASGTYGTGKEASFGAETVGSDASLGALVANEEGSKANPIAIKNQGPYMIEVNMLNLTYTVKSAFEQLYTPGNSNDWKQPESQILTTDDYVLYQGFAHLNGGFKFSTALDWSGTNFGNGGEGNKLSTDGGASDLKAPEDGLYWVTVNIPELTYAITKIDKVGLVGDATPNGWDEKASTALTPSADFLTWTATVTLKEGSFKFCMNDAWTINLGGKADNLVFNSGDNVPSPGAGSYKVTLDLSKVPYTCTFAKQ